MADTIEIALIRNKIMGALISDARKTSGKTLADATSTLGLSEAEYGKFESGDATPTLPQLEVLAYLYNVPLDHFWGTETRAAARKEDDVKEKVPQMLALRNKIIGAYLRNVRNELNLSAEQVASNAGLSVEQLDLYESGNEAPQVHVLQKIAGALGIRIEDLTDKHGSVGNWLLLQSEFQEFAKLPDDMREFLLKPINRSYLEVAMRLSAMQVDRLRNIAEGILDITF